MTWIYIKSAPELWTVGVYDPAGNWIAESDHGSPDQAAERVHWLNGGENRRAEGTEAGESACPTGAAARDIYIGVISRMKTIEEFGDEPPEPEDWAATLSDLIVGARRLSGVRR